MYQDSQLFSFEDKLADSEYAPIHLTVKYVFIWEIVGLTIAKVFLHHTNMCNYSKCGKMLRMFYDTNHNK